jgi:TonB-dependent receptor
VHSRYALAPNLVLHASFGTTSGRPNWGQILGVTDANEITHTINVPNLELKPRTSKNYDLSLEYYFEPVGVISVGVFQKDIKNYDVSAEWQVTAQEAIDLGAQPAPGDTTPWLVTSRLNAGFGRVRGIELNYSQSLSKLLPGPFRGLGVFSNFTYLQTEGTFDNAGTAGAPPVKTNRLQGFIPRTANAGLSYLYNRYDLRVSWNYTDDWPENTPSNPATTKVRGERWSLDFTGKYRVTRNITFFADMVNLTSNHGKKYRGYVDPALRNETNALGFLLTAGVQATF